MTPENYLFWILFIVAAWNRSLRSKSYITKIFVANTLIGSAASGESSGTVIITKLDVPRYVTEGEDAIMTCEYKSTFKIYSIKWYRNDREFFHFIPSQDPPKRGQTIPGINVDIVNSNGTTVILRYVTMDAEGRYKCEVSEEWPEYFTVDQSATMSVVVIPKAKPKIYGANHQYRFGDPVHLTCISEPSRPAANLTWYINDEEAPVDNMERLTPIHTHLTQSRLVLKFELTRLQFTNGKLNLRCSAQISPLYHKTEEHTVNEEISFNIPRISAKEMAGYSGFSSASSINNSFFWEKLILQIIIFTLICQGKNNFIT